MYIKKNRLPNLVLTFFAVIWSAITIYPLIFTINSSFKTTDQIYSAPFKFPSVYSFANYSTALVKAGMFKAIVNSFLISLFATLCVMLFASLASFIIARFNLKYSNSILMYFLLGIMIPIHSTLIPLVRMISLFHGQNHYLTMILIYTAFNLPFAIFLIASHMKGISKDMDESAIIDGCGPFKLFWQIIGPLAMPAVSTAAIITFLYVYNDLIFAVVFISKKSMFTIPLSMLTFVAYRQTEYGPIFASIVISILPMIIIFLFFQEKVVSGLAAGAVKE